MKTCSLRAAAAFTSALTTALAPIAASAQTATPAAQYEYRKLAKTLTVNGEASPVQPGGEASGGTQGSPVLGVSSLAVDFGNVATNTTEKRQVVVSNDGTGTLSFTAAPTVTGAAEFAASLTTCGSTLAAGADCLAEATFSPTTTGTFNGLLTFTAAAAGSPKEVTLVGTAFNPVSLASATLPTARLNKAYAPFSFVSLLNASNEAMAPDLGQVTWDAQGTLPEGMSFDAATATLAGTPTALTPEAGQDFTVLATYKNNQGQQVYTIKVGNAVLEVVQISVGGYHTCAVTTAGAAKCWGYNFYGQLGNNSTTNSSTPVSVVGLTSGTASVSAGWYHTCAVSTAGGARCWGQNSGGKLGDNPTTQRLTPVYVSGLSYGVAAVSASYAHTCALTTSGGAKCWGNGGNGELGTNTTSSSAVPVSVMGLTSGVASVSAGSNFTCAVTTAGGAKCWGLNDYGQLGDNTTTPRVVPVDVLGLTTGIQNVAVGWYHACGATSSGVKCWGYNTHGQSGDGTSTFRLAPVDVLP